MINKISNMIKVIARELAVAFFFSCLCIVIINVLLGRKITTVINLANMMSIDTSNYKEKEITIDPLEKSLINYPEYGKVFAKIKSEKIDMNLNLYQGDEVNLLLYGIGHFIGSYFPGEGGTILLAGHNTPPFFHRLYELKPGDEIVIEAVYGTYRYKMREYKILTIAELEKIDINKNKEELVMYTCYPFNSLGFKSKRYVLYADLIGEENE